MRSLPNRIDALDATLCTIGDQCACAKRSYATQSVEAVPRQTPLDRLCGPTHITQYGATAFEDTVGEVQQPEVARQAGKDDSKTVSHDDLHDDTRETMTHQLGRDVSTPDSDDRPTLVIVSERA